MLVLSIAAVFSAIQKDSPLSFYLLGSVRANASLSVSIFEEVFPFNLDGSDVSFNPATDVVYGLRIGEYTLVSNASSTTLYITHTPLILEGTDGSVDGEGHYRKIDYRLYAMVNLNNVIFKSCVSDTSAATPGSATELIELSGAVRLVNKSLYVSLDEGSASLTEDVVENLVEGLYKSNIYFLLRGE